MQPEQLPNFRTSARPQLHPDGHRIAFEVSQMDLDGDRYQRSIWLWDGEARQFTAGPGDTAPRWAPDGTTLAFLRKVDDDPAQLAVIPAGGGEAEVITDFDLGAERFEWSPDGTRLAVVGKSWISGWAGLDEDERARKPRRITHAVYRFDSRGWLHDRRSHVWIVDPSGEEEARRLTEADPDQQAPVWHPDGTRIALLTSLDNESRMHPGTDILEVEAAGGEVTVRHQKGGWSNLAYRPDGRLLALGDVDPEAWPTLTSLWRIDDAGPVDLTGRFDRSVWSFTLPPEMAQPAWQEEGFLIGLVDAGRVGVIRVTDDGEQAKLLGGNRYVNGFDATPDGSRVVFVASDPTNPGELYEMVDGEERALTDLNGEFRASTPLAEADHFRVESDGVEIDTWVYLPPGDGPCPVLLNIHGGPASQYGFNFFDEFQVYAGAGYSVVACNPRGSDGRGRDFLRAVTGDGWGKVDLADVTAAVEAALERHPRLDADRIGIMGGSYGGFLTAWTIARDHRYRSAVVERALLNWESFSGTSDIAPHFSRMYLGAEPPGDDAVLRAASPSASAGEITTPTLIVHSEADYRCPIEQAEQLFMTLLRNEVDTELIRFPGESHELSRSGKPRHRRERFEYILEWHDRYLQS